MKAHVDDDPLAMNLMDRLLSVNPGSRGTAKDAAIHPWFADDPLPLTNLVIKANKRKENDSQKVTTPNLEGRN